MECAFGSSQLLRWDRAQTKILTLTGLARNARIFVRATNSTQEALRVQAVHEDDLDLSRKVREMYGNPSS